MPLPVCRESPLTRAASFSASVSNRRQAYVRFGRSKPVTWIFGVRSPSMRTISLRTLGVAVAVRAMVAGDPICSRTSPRRMYSVRKSCPQKLRQCASSITSRFGLSCGINRWKDAAAKRSGARYSKPVKPFLSCARTSDCSDPDCELFRSNTGTPNSCSCRTWSAISEISGETTTVRPFNITGRKLKAEALPGARRHDAYHVVAGEHVIDDLPLMRAEQFRSRKARCKISSTVFILLACSNCNGWS